MNGSSAGAPLLEVKQLSVTFETPQGPVHAVRDASFEIKRGEVVGLVGESGSGKSTVAFAIMGYLPGSARLGGEVRFEGRRISEIGNGELRRLRGQRIAMVYQDPFTALNPTMPVGKQIEEVVRTHLGMNARQARDKVAELFESVHLPEPQRIGRRYPHQLSGGMQQRVLIAMALACSPDLLLMDEPTTGLDVTTEATILDLVLELKGRVDAGVLFITHNLGVIARVADRVAVLYAGQVAEQGSTRELFKDPRHPYTLGLLNCVPKPPLGEQEALKLPNIPGNVFDARTPDIDACLFADRCPIVRDLCRQSAPQLATVQDTRLSRCHFPNEVVTQIWGQAEFRESDEGVKSAEPILIGQSVQQFYGHSPRKLPLLPPLGAPPVRALVDVDFQVLPSKTLGIVGESGSGKTTLARAIVGLVPRTGGALTLRGKALAPRVEDRDTRQRGALRLIFQNPIASLNPKLPIRHALVRSLQKFAHMSRRESVERAGQMLQAVGMDPLYLERLPSELSGGQQQRVALAVALAANPSVVVADEAVSALDVSVQAQVLNLLQEHQRKAGTSYVFITHDLGVVRYISDFIIVLYAGHVAESGPADAIMRPPFHPYSEALLSAAPSPDPDARPARIRLQGQVPSLRTAFPGCPFASRCPRKVGTICDTTPPPTQFDPEDTQHIINCHIPLEELSAMQAREVHALQVVPRHSTTSG